VPGDVRGVGGAVVGPDQMQAEVDARGGAGAGGHVAQVDVEGVGLDQHLRSTGGQLGGHPPVGGGPAAVEQSRLGQQEGAGAEGDDARPAPVGPPHRVDHGGTGGFVRSLPAGDHDGVGGLQRGQTVAHGHVVARQGRHRSRTFGAHREVVAGGQAGTGHPEDLGGARQLEGRLRGQDEGHHPV
jgi:hypothetical protein